MFAETFILSLDCSTFNVIKIFGDISGESYDQIAKYSVMQKENKYSLATKYATEIVKLIFFDYNSAILIV